MKSKIDTFFTDNLMFIMMCRELIMKENRYKNCIVRHKGAIQATLGAYIYFWTNHLPLSVDDKAEPICAVEEDKIYVADEDRIRVANANGEISEIVKCFRECQNRYPSSSAGLELQEVVCELTKMIAESKLTEIELCAWQPFYYPAKISVLEYQISRLKAENNLLRLQGEAEQEDKERAISQYVDVFRKGEMGFNETVFYYRRKHKDYRKLLNSIRSYGIKINGSEHMPHPIDLSMAIRDAISWVNHCRFNGLETYFKEIPQVVTQLPIELINKVCGISLESPYKAVGEIEHE